MSRNGLVSLPDELCGLPLKVLEADNNAIARLPDRFGRLEALVRWPQTCELSLYQSDQGHGAGWDVGLKGT